MAYNRRETDTLMPMTKEPAGTQPVQASCCAGAGFIRRRSFRRASCSLSSSPFICRSSYRATGTIMLEPSADSGRDGVVHGAANPGRRRTDHAQQEVELLQATRNDSGKTAAAGSGDRPVPGGQDRQPGAKAQRVADNTSVERVDPITLKPLDESTAFSVHYDNPRPQHRGRTSRKSWSIYT